MAGGFSVGFLVEAGGVSLELLVAFVTTGGSGLLVASLSAADGFSVLFSAEA